MIDTTEHKPASPDVMIGITSPRQFRMANELGRELRRRGRDVSYVAIKGRYGWFTSDWRVPARCLGEQHVEEFESPYIEQDTSLTPFQRCLRGMLPFIPFSAVSRLRKLLYVRQLARSFAAKHTPRVMVCFTMPPEAALILKYAKRSGTRIVVCQEGMWLEPSRTRGVSFTRRAKTAICRLCDRIGFPIQGTHLTSAGRECDLYCVEGHHTRRVLLRNSVPNTKIQVTGMLDDHAMVDACRSVGAQSIPLELQSLTDLQWIVYAKQSDRYRVGQDERLVLELARFAALHERCVVVIKLHPFDPQSVEHWKRCIASAGLSSNRCIVLRDADMCALVRHAHVLITAYSGVGMFALVVGVPLVIIDYLEVEYSLDFLGLDYGAAVVVHDPTQLGAAIRTIANDEDLRREIVRRQGEALPQLVAAHDGQTLARIADAVESVISEQCS